MRKKRQKRKWSENFPWDILINCGNWFDFYEFAVVWVKPYENQMIISSKLRTKEVYWNPKTFIFGHCPCVNFISFSLPPQNNDDDTFLRWEDILEIKRCVIFKLTPTKVTKNVSATKRIFKYKCNLLSCFKFFEFSNE